MLNDVANDPEVRPWLQGDGPLDLTPVIANPLNVALVTTGGGFVMINAGSGDYEVHSIFRRGAKMAYAAMLAGFDYMFTRTDCLRLTTKLPDGNAHAALLASAGGFAPLFRNEVTATACVDLTLDRWAMRTDDLAVDGEWFHARIDEAKSSAMVDHPADAMHDRAVGAAVRMFRAGNVQKGVWYYNRWATHAGYPGVRLISEHPCILDMGEAVVQVRGDEMDILSCQ